MRSRNIVIYGAVAVLAAGLGVTGGAAIAGVPTIFTPAGVYVDGPSVPKPEPTYALNEQELTVGTLAGTISPGTEPDLILAVATNGREGYVYKRDLDAADGTTAMKEFKSPEDALAWQKERGTKTIVIPVYLEDGKTVVGQFEVGGAPSVSDK